MRTPLFRCIPLRGPVEELRARLTGSPAVWLPGTARPTGPETWGVTLHYRRMSRSVTCRVGPAWSVAGTLTRTIAWEPLPEDGDVLPLERLLPSFEGHLELHGTSTTGAVLVLSGTYEPPGGVAGSLATMTVLHRVAEATATRFLEEVAVGLSATVPA